jgi:UDP-perosamine 4-acetyltransferase
MRVIGLGAGGHAKVVIDILRLMGGCELGGLLDPNRELWGTAVLGVPVLGDDALLPTLQRQGIRHAFVGMGSSGDTGPRRRLYERLRASGFEPVTAIHPRAVIAPSAVIGPGATLMANVVINAAARLEEDVVVNAGAVIEHDCVVGAHAYVATGAHLSSTVRVGEGAHIGTGASIRQCLSIGEGAVVGAGAAVVKDVEPWTLVVGVPARPLRRLTPTVRQAAEPTGVAP